MKISPDAYQNEPIRYRSLQVVDLKRESGEITDSYRNQVISQVNTSCLRLAVFDGPYRWHYHTKSDELFLVLEGLLVIDLENAQELRLSPWQCVTIPAGTVHRTRALGRTVNLCFEALAAETVFVDRAENS